MANDPRPSRSLHDMAELLGSRVWLERRLFELLGSWASAGSVGEVQLHLADASRRHSWHAQVWFDRLPELSSLDVDALVVPPAGAIAEVLELLDAVGSEHDPATASIARLDGYHRSLLPRMIVAYRSTLEVLGTAADASVARWSRLVLVDDLEEWEQGEAVLQRAVRSEPELDVIAATRGAIERRLLGAAALPV